MIIDCHCHAGQGDGITGPRGQDAPLAGYLKRARAAGITRTILFGTFQTSSAATNAYVARLVARYPARFVGFVFVHATRDAGRIGEIVGAAVQEWGFRGIKVHLYDAPASHEVCDAARTWRVPILYDIMGDPGMIAGLADRYANVNFIIPHLGSYGDSWPAQRRLVDQLVAYPNVYADTSGVRRFDMLARAVERAGARKLLFGTDGPWLHPALELQKIRLLQLPPPEEALILGRNVLRLIKDAQVAIPTGPITAS